MVDSVQRDYDLMVDPGKEERMFLLITLGKTKMLEDKRDITGS